MKGQFKKGKGDNIWYLIVFGDADVLRKFANIWKSIRAKIEENTGGIVQYDKDYMKIKFESNDKLPIDNIVNMHQVTIIIRSIFAQNGKFYPQFFKDIEFKFQEHVCSKCHDLLAIAYSLKDIATFRCILMGISKNEGLKRLNNSVTYDRGVL